MNEQESTLEELINQFPEVNLIYQNEDAEDFIGANAKAAVWLLQNAELIKEYLEELL